MARSDEKYPYSDFGVELAGWSSVLDVSFTQNIHRHARHQVTPRWFTEIGTELVGISAAGVGHTVPVDAVSDLAWFWHCS